MSEPTDHAAVLRQVQRALYWDDEKGQWDRIKFLGSYAQVVRELQILVPCPINSPSPSGASLVSCHDLCVEILRVLKEKA